MPGNGADERVISVAAPGDEPKFAWRRGVREFAGTQLPFGSADEMRKQGYARAGLCGRGLRGPVAGPEGHARMGKFPGQPQRFGKMGIGLVETDEHGLVAGVDPAAAIGGRVEAETHRHESPGDDIAILRTAKSQGDVCLAPFEADGSKVGCQIDVESRLLPGQPGEAMDEEVLREARGALMRTSPVGAPDVPLWPSLAAAASISLAASSMRAPLRVRT